MNTFRLSAVLLDVVISALLAADGRYRDAYICVMFAMPSLLLHILDPQNRQKPKP